MDNLLENLTVTTMPINTFVGNERGTFQRREFAGHGFGWWDVTHDEIILDINRDTYTYPAVAPLTSEEYFAKHPIKEILAMPPMWVAQVVAQELVSNMIIIQDPSPEAFADYRKAAEELATFNPDDYDWSNKNDRQN